MEIQIKTIPHNQHRYPTCGDYWVDENGVIQLRVSEEAGTEIEQFAIALHELVELMLCRQRGVKFADIDTFDELYEEQREHLLSIKDVTWIPFDIGHPEKITATSEPGDSPRAPYRKEHRFAENIERQFIHEAGINWATYNAQVESL